MGAALSPYALDPEPPFSETDFAASRTPAGRARRARARAGRARSRARRRYTPRAFPRRAKTCRLNQCRTDWPGGYRCSTRGGAAGGGWVATGFAGGAPTNPRCYPPRGQEHQDTANDGTFAGARRAATLGHENPDAIARAVNGITAALAAGRIGEGRAGALIAGLITPGMAAAQAGERIQPLTEADRAARAAARGTRVDLLGALSLREVADACRKRPGEWYCLDRWPGGWITPDAPGFAAGGEHWKGPTEYGKFVEGCFGYQYNPLDTIGRWIITTTAGAPGAIAAPLARIWQALVPTPAGVTPAPPAPPADLWMCREGWPGGWMPLPEYIAKGSPSGWRGPTAYGVPVAGCFGGS